MPVRFTCRVSVFRTSSGKFRLRYAPTDTMCSPPEEVPDRLLTINSPSMIIPPDAEMTEDELDQWKLATPGCSITHETIPTNAPLVEAHRTIEDLIPKGSVTWRFQEPDDREGERTFNVVLQSTWHGLIPRNHSRSLIGGLLASVGWEPQIRV